MKKVFNTTIVLLLTMMSTYTVFAFTTEKVNFNHERVNSTNHFNNLSTLNSANHIASFDNNYCSIVAVTGDISSITISGITAPWQSVQYKLEGAAVYTSACNDNCGNPEVISGLSKGKYIVRVEQSDGGSVNHCVVEIAALVSGSGTDYCKNVQVTGGIDRINVSGVNAPWHKIQYRLDGGSTYYEVCNDNCSNPHIISGLAKGKYVIRVEQSSGGGVDHCVREIAAIVTGPGVDYCKNVQVTGGVGTITVSGVNAPWHKIQYRLDGGSTYYEVCNDNCSNPHIISGLAKGKYVIRVEQSSGGGVDHCVREIAAIVTGPGVDYCKNVYVTGGAGSITIKGVNAPWHRIQYRLDGTYVYSDICNDNCSDPHTVTGLSAGLYIIRVEQSSGGSADYCIKEVAVHVSGTSVDYCKNVQVIGGVGSITVKGVNAPWNKIQYRLDGGSTYYEVCNDNCADPQTITGLAPGKYIVRAEQSSGGGINHCVVEIAANVTSTSAIDYCSDVVVNGGVGTITIDGITAPWNRAQYRSRDNYVYYDLCNDNCGYSQTFSGIPVGSYLVRIEQSSGGSHNYCSVELPVEVISSASFSYCDDVEISSSGSKIIIKGVNAPWNRIQIKGPSTDHKPYTICDDNCYDPSYTHIEVRNLKAGHYTVTTEESNGQYSYCKVNRTVYVSSNLTNSNEGSRTISTNSDLVNTDELALSLADNRQPTPNIVDLGEQSGLLNTTSSLNLKEAINAIKVYPNPARNEVFVNLAPFSGKRATIMIINQVGALVQEIEVDEIMERALLLDISQFDSGLYFMRARIDDNQWITKKFMVSK